jgi:hypothetical protein
VEIELSVSDEIVESGRGMMVTLSSKPTRGRDGGLVGSLSKGGPKGSDAGSFTFGADVERSRGGDTAGCSIGVFGRLWLRRGRASEGCMMLLTLQLNDDEHGLVALPVEVLRVVAVV